MSESAALSASDGDQYVVASVARALEILDHLAASPVPLTLKEIAEGVGLPRPTVLRLVRTLQVSNWVEREEHRYRIGFKGFQMGAAAGASLEVRTVSLPFIIELRDLVGHNVQVAKLVQWHVVYLERVLAEGASPVLQARAGAILSSHCTGLGKALLAFRNLEDVAQWASRAGLPRFTPDTITDVGRLLEALVEVRDRGYAVEMGERQPEVACVAAPVRDFSGEVVAAISVAGLRSDLPSQLVGSDLAGQVLDTARRVSVALGYSLAPDSA